MGELGHKRPNTSGESRSTQQVNLPNEPNPISGHLLRRMPRLLVRAVAALGLVLLAPLHAADLNRALIDAIARANTPETLALLAQGADPNARDDSGQTALIL